MAGEQPVVLERMAQQSGLLGAEDDWTGMTSSAARRRVQNRINQRAYRRRRRMEVKQSSSSIPRPPLENLQVDISSETSEIEPVEGLSPHEELWKLFSSGANRTQLSRKKLCHVAAICKLKPVEQYTLFLEFKRWVQSCQRMGSPRSDYLLILIKFNVFRAMLSNGGDLGYKANAAMDADDALSPFTNPSNPRWQVRSVPAALQPTRLQRQIPHHPWIDMLPSPVMRDNLLRAGDTFDDGELCADLVGFFNESTGRTGMIVWGEPWDIDGWEVTESFVKHWWWTIEGCEQLLRATNHWRRQRGEGALQVERILREEVGE